MRSYTQPTARFVGMLFVVLLAAWISGRVMAQDPVNVPTTQTAPPAEHVVIAPADLNWQPAPPSVPPGAQVAMLEGDMKSSGPFTMRVKFPADYIIAPHWHPNIEHVTVLSGALNVGMGDQFDKSKTKEIPAGGFALMPTGMHHFAWTGQETIIQVHGMGPWGINYINPADDPRKK